MNDNTAIKITAIGGICAMEISAMALMHLDGAMLAACVGAISGLAGYELGKKQVV
jgi:hypothetical protein